MIKKDVEKFITGKYHNSLDTITNLSKTDGGEAFIISDEKMYNYDTITKELFVNRNIPSSADAIDFSNNYIEIFEFKTGFKKKITRENFDKSKMTCPKTNKYCKEYGDLFFKGQRKETEQLIDSIRLKAIESYITLEKMIMPTCNNTTDDLKLCFCVIIDSDDIDSMEDTLTELANVEVKNNSVADVKKALSRFCNKADVTGNTYYYDSIEVLSPIEFKSRII